MNSKTVISFAIFALVCAGTLVGGPNVTAANASLSEAKTALFQEDEVRKKAKQRVSQLYKDLEMNRDQYNEAWDVTYNYEKQLHQITNRLADEEGNAERGHERFKRAVDQFKSKMKDVLNKNQYEQFSDGDWEAKDKRKVEAALK